MQLQPFLRGRILQSNELQKILMRYQSSCLKDGPLTDANRARITVLRSALGLDEVAASAAPAQVGATTAEKL
jgi:hypothetical protein